MTSDKRLGLILPSFNDIRIGQAIESIRRFDDANCVKLFVIDGGSSPEVCDIIRPLIREGDVFIHERDRGIFDALNKGLELCDTEFIGWLGSDDLFTGQVPSSEVLKSLAENDLFVANLAIFSDGRVRRLTHAWPSAMGLVRFGLHNPHYATFGRADLFKSERFSLQLMGADIAYFIRLFARKPRVDWTSCVGTLQCAGGFSNASCSRTWHINWQLLQIYGAATHPVIAPFAVLVKIGYKIWSSMYYMLFKLESMGLEVQRPSAEYIDKSPS